MTTAAQPVAAATHPAPTLSVVICAYTTRRWEDLCASVGSVLGQSIPSAPEVILVIDHCDELFEMSIQRFGPDPRVTVVRNTGMQGLSGARNTGVKTARGDIVGFLDDDATADPGWACALLQHYLDDTVACVGGYAAPVWPPGGRPAWLPPEFDWVVGCSYIGQPTTVATVRNPIGANMSLRRSVVEAAGGFRSEVGRVGTTPVGGEETELCIRIGALDKAHQILLDPDMSVHHRVSPDRVTLGYFVRRCYHEGLSKAVVVSLAAGLAAGHGSLSSESAYVRAVLPAAVLRELGSLTAAGWTRAGVIVLGLFVTTAGYLRARVSRRLTRRARR